MNKQALELTTLMGLASSGSGFDYRTGRYPRSYSPTPCKEHRGVTHLVNQPKKLRKGAGHRKLTRAQRRRII